MKPHSYEKGVIILSPEERKIARAMVAANADYKQIAAALKIALTDAKRWREMYVYNHLRRTRPSREFVSQEDEASTLLSANSYRPLTTGDMVAERERANALLDDWFRKNPERATTNNITTYRPRVNA